MNSLFRISLALFVLLLTACGPTGDTEGLKQNVETNKLSITSLIIKPSDTQTLAPLSTPPANPKYYLADNDTEQLQAYGVTATNDEILLSDVRWSITDNTNSAGATGLSQTGLLTTESLGLNQTKEIAVNISYSSLKATADIVISSYPLAANGLTLKINGIEVNDNDTRSVVVCDTATLAAEGLFDDGSKREITSKINWPAATTDSNARFDTTDPNHPVFYSHTIASYTVTPDYMGQGTTTVYLDVTETGFSNFTLSPTSVSLPIGASYQLTARADIDSGSGKINQNVSGRAKWTSADNTVFTVDDTGLVAGIATGGPANATAQCGSAAITSSVTVDSDMLGIEILDQDANVITDYLELAITGGTSESVDLQLRVIMVDGSENDITTDADTTWEVKYLPGEGEPITVDNKDNKGRVTATAAGIALIVAKYKDSENDLIVIVRSN